MPTFIHDFRERWEANERRISGNDPYVEETYRQCRGIKIQLLHEAFRYIANANSDVSRDEMIELANVVSRERSYEIAGKAGG